MNGSKTVTRRMGWCTLKPGQELNAVRKCMGFKKGEKITVLGRIKVVSVTRERLGGITQAECVKEGFPHISPAEFIKFFCSTHKGCGPESLVTRIEFIKGE